MVKARSWAQFRFHTVFDCRLVRLFASASWVAASGISFHHQRFSRGRCSWCLASVDVRSIANLWQSSTSKCTWHVPVVTRHRHHFRGVPLARDLSIELARVVDALVTLLEVSVADAFANVDVSHRLNHLFHAWLLSVSQLPVVGVFDMLSYFHLCLSKVVDVFFLRGPLPIRLNLDFVCKFYFDFLKQNVWPMVSIKLQCHVFFKDWKERRAVTGKDWCWAIARRAKVASVMLTQPDKFKTFKFLPIPNFPRLKYQTSIQLQSNLSFKKWEYFVLPVKSKICYVCGGDVKFFNVRTQLQHLAKLQGKNCSSSLLWLAI